MAKVELSLWVTLEAENQHRQFYYIESFHVTGLTPNNLFIDLEATMETYPMSLAPKTKTVSSRIDRERKLS